MRKALGIVWGFGVWVTASTFAVQAYAQQPAPEGTTAPPPATVEGQAELPAPAPPPPPPPPTEPAPATTPVAAARPEEPKADDGITDHEKVVGKFGVMYFGVTDQPIGVGPGVVGNNAGANVGRGTVQTPVIGVRYWLQERLGIDVGLGLNFFSSARSVEQNNVEVSTDGPAVMAFAIHGGVPLAFAYGKHYKFLLVPELNFGYATQTAAAQNIAPGQPAPPDLHLSGIRFDVGARIGSEIQFGFIGIPQLALQASVGLNFRHRIWSASQDAGPPLVPNGSSSSENQSDFGTTVQADPWALFVNNISAIYYFP